MNAVVLAGGYATRMWPITRERPKMFLPVGDVTIIDTIFEDLEADDRISEVYVSTNEYFEEEFEEYLAESEFEKPTLSIEETREEDAKFGVVAALAELVEREGIDESLLVVAGDNLIGFDLGEFVDFFERRGTPCLAAYDVGTKERAKSYGPITTDGTEVLELQEKPEHPKSTVTSIACYAFPEETVPALHEYLAAGNNPDEPGWFIRWLIERGEVHAYTFDGEWFDVGEADAYLDAVAWRLGNEALVEDGASVTDTDVGPGVHVMEGAEVSDATLEETVVFPGATIRESDLRRSVVDEEARVENLDLSRTLVGAYSKLRSE